MDPKTIQNPQNPSLNHSINTDKAVTVKVWGERLGSPYNERRKLYIEVVASNPPAWVRGLTDLLQYAVYNIKSLLLLFIPQFPNLTPWWLFSQCKHCVRRFSESIAHGLPTNTWRTAFCLRHGILFNGALFDVDNKERIVSSDGTNIVFSTSTNKYMAKFIIHKDHAEVSITNLVNNRILTFKYRNHVDSYPFTSTYAFLVRRILGFANSLRDVVRICGVRNIYVNGVQVCPPPSDAPASGGEGEVADGGGGEVGEGEGGGV
jgi:hypothetical protein